MSINPHVQKALSEVLERELPDLTEKTRLFEDLGLDSTSVIDLLMELEDETSMSIDPAELSAEIFETVGTLSAYVTENSDS